MTNIFVRRYVIIAAVVTCLAVSTLLLALHAFRGERRGTLVGKVFDPLGVPVSADVSIVGQAGSVKTEASGQYRLRYIPGRFTVRYSGEKRVSREISWDLYEAATVSSAPVILAARPEHAGLWTLEDGGYAAIVPVPVRHRQTSAFGLTTVMRRQASIEGQPRRWCLEHPLVLYNGSGLDAITLSAWEVDRDGTILTGLAEKGGRSAGVELERVGSSLALVRSLSEGGLALVLTGREGGGLGESAYYLDASQCEEGS